MFACSLRYPARIAHSPCRHMWPVWLYHLFPHYLILHDFRKQFIEHKMCVLIFCTPLSETFLILRKTEWDMVINVLKSLCKVPAVRFLRNLNFIDSFWKNTQISNILKIRPVGAELFRVDGQTDMTKLLAISRTRLKMKVSPRFGQWVPQKWDSGVDRSLLGHTRTLLMIRHSSFSANVQFCQGIKQEFYH
jgi:hypothetical protein